MTERPYQTWIATTIQAERAARGLTLQVLSNRSRIHMRVLFRAIKCERDMTTEQLSRIAGALGMSPADLLSEAERRMHLARQRDA